MVLLLCASLASAQSITFPTTAFRPGQPIPVTITADAPGLIQLRGETIQGIDWPAPGRGSVAVPLTVFGDPGKLSLTLNGKPQAVSLIVLNPSDPAPPVLAKTESLIETAAARLIARQVDDYTLEDWSPGRPIEQRRWLAIAAIASVFAVAAVQPWRGGKNAMAALIISAVACTAMACFAPSPPVRREQRSSEQGFDLVDYYATQPTVIREPISADTRLASAGGGDVTSLKPVLECDERGKPRAIRIELPAKGRARFIELEGVTP